jgi:hypothetical protein
MAIVKHIVLLRFKDSTTDQKIEEIMSSLASLKEKCPGILEFKEGPYSSPEGLNKEFQHGFIMTFDSEANRNIYLEHPDHEVVKQLAFGEIEGGLDGIVAFDFLISE